MDRKVFVGFGIITLWGSGRGRVGEIRTGYKYRRVGVIEKTSAPLGTWNQVIGKLHFK